MKTFLKIALICSIVIGVANAVPKRRGRKTTTTEDPRISDEIIKVFGTDPTTTPQMIFRNDAPDLNTEPTEIDSYKPCYDTCVEYYLCDRRNGKVIHNDTSNSEELVINPRLLPTSCEYMQVCCIDDDKKSEPIAPAPTVDVVPTYKDGCGVRNINGIDFELAGGDLVSSFQLVLMNSMKYTAT